MIRLIACDIDGTLLFPWQREVAPAVLHEIPRLAAKGIRFCPTSGRRLESLRRLFASVADELYYICENGSTIYAPGGTLLGTIAIPRADALTICHDILARPDCELMVSGVDGCYLFPKGPEVVEVIKEVGNHLVYVPAPEDIPEEILKVSAFCPDAAALAPEMTGLPLPPRIAGECWVDFTRSDKADGLRRLGELLGVAREEILAIGDNYNDVGMLDYAGSAYLMASAAPELLARFPQHCERVEELLQTL